MLSSISTTLRVRSLSSCASKQDRLHCFITTMSMSSPILLLLLFLLIPDTPFAQTDSAHVSALNVMYNSMNNPSQLSDWSGSGGDPCGQSWQGITCSGSSITEINLSGRGLTGSLGYQLSSLTSVTKFDLSQNNFKSEIPYQLPPNAQEVNLAGNSFTGGVPYSISQMPDLKYLNLANNQLNGQLSDMFGKMSSLETMDLSSNQLSGNLPQSFGSLKNLKTLYLQDNRFSGTLNVVANLALNELNVQNNRFTGWIPSKLKDISVLKVDGNSWSSGQAPPGEAEASSHTSLIGLTAAGIVVSVIAILLVVMMLLALVKRKSNNAAIYIDDRTSQNKSFTSLPSNDFNVDIKALERSSSVNDELGSKFSSRRSTAPITLTAYSLMDLQAATSNFSENLCIGKGTIGRVYRAKFADGKIVAVKNIDVMDNPGGSSYDFMEVASGISKLHHRNILELKGYCSEPGHPLLVYDYQLNGSLHGFLHLSNDYSRPLTWDTRVRIALGIARALQYLHEVCSPSCIHKNLKSANILLDAELNPHLADCGLAVLYENTSENLRAGYLAPECGKSSSYSVKSDVYSFGVVMLELLTGHMPFDSSRPEVEQSLVSWATPQLRDVNASHKIVDPALRGLYPPKSLSRFADVIALCVQSEPESRPAMSEVVQALSGCVNRTSVNKKLGWDLGASGRSENLNKKVVGDLGASGRSEDSDYGYY